MFKTAHPFIFESVENQRSSTAKFHSNISVVRRYFPREVYLVYALFAFSSFKATVDVASSLVVYAKPSSAEARMRGRGGKSTDSTMNATPHNFLIFVSKSTRGLQWKLNAVYM